MKTTWMACPVLVGLGACSAQAVTLNPVADTFLNRGDTDQANGSATGLLVTNDGGSAISKTKDRYAVLRFDLSSQTGPFTAATFTATSNTTDSFAFQLWAIPDGGADENFDEATLTFDTFDYASETLDGSIDTSGLSLLVNNVTDATDGLADNVYTFSSANLLDFLNADTNGIVTFVLFRTTPHGDHSTFGSREAKSGAPQLILQVPEPASLALLGLGGLVALPRWRNEIA